MIAQFYENKCQRDNHKTINTVTETSTCNIPALGEVKERGKQEGREEGEEGKRERERRRREEGTRKEPAFIAIPQKKTEIHTEVLKILK